MTALLPAPRLDLHPPTRSPAPSRERRPTAIRSAVVRHPTPRDPFVDGIRVLGILLVIALHWTMVEAHWDGQHFTVGNALSHGVGWLLTWLQPLPVLFFAAGAAAQYDLARHPDLSGWKFTGVRVQRLARPVGIFLGIWAALVVALPRMGVPWAMIDRAAHIVPQPLWFLAVQVALLLVTPLMRRMITRWGGTRVLVVAATLPFIVDLLRFTQGAHLVGSLNLLLVWAVPYLGGLLYAMRRSAPPTPPRREGLSERTWLALLGGAGLFVTIILIIAGPYLASLIGMPGDAISNLAPPTAPVVSFCVAQVAAVLLARDAITAWAGRSTMVRWTNAHSMGLYLWHLTAMFAVVGLVLIVVGQELPTPWTWAWWTSRPSYVLVAALLLTAFVGIAQRTENALRRRPLGSSHAPGNLEHQLSAVSRRPRH